MPISSIEEKTCNGIVSNIRLGSDVVVAYVVVVVLLLLNKRHKVHGEKNVNSSGIEFYLMTICSNSMSFHWEQLHSTHNSATNSFTPVLLSYLT